MIKIKVFCPFSSSKNCKEIYEKINYANEIPFYGKDKKIYLTEHEDYTHAIIINTIMPKLKDIPKENVIGLAFEPIYFLGLSPKFIEYAKKYISKYLIGDKMDLPDPFIEHFGYMWHSRPPREITNKSKLMSIIVSEKKNAPGHMYRHNLVELIIQHKLPIDIYGHGSTNYKYNRVMGKFADSEPYEDYMFSICIENYVCNHYFSEKVITPLMYNCNPIYLGCRNINSYVENVISIGGNANKDIETIIKILDNPQLYYKKTYTKKNIQAVNLIQHIESLYSHSHSVI
jgi:hypothetical protein